MANRATIHPWLFSGTYRALLPLVPPNDMLFLASAGVCMPITKRVDDGQPSCKNDNFHVTCRPCSALWAPSSLGNLGIKAKISTTAATSTTATEKGTAAIPYVIPKLDKGQCEAVWERYVCSRREMKSNKKKKMNAAMDLYRKNEMYTTYYKRREEERKKKRMKEASEEGKRGMNEEGNENRADEEKNKTNAIVHCNKMDQILERMDQITPSSSSPSSESSLEPKIFTSHTATEGEGSSGGYGSKEIEQQPQEEIIVKDENNTI